MHYLVIARNAFETVAMSASSYEEAEQIRDGFVKDSERQTHRASREASPGVAVAVALDVVILSRAHAGTIYREG